MSMPEKRAKPTKSPKSAKSADKPVASRKRATGSRKPSHDEIAERAYFIHLEEGGSDELENWLRAERELSTSRVTRSARGSSSRS